MLANDGQCGFTSSLAGDVIWSQNPSSSDRGGGVYRADMSSWVLYRLIINLRSLGFGSRQLHFLLFQGYTEKHISDPGVKMFWKN